MPIYQIEKVIGKGCYGNIYQCRLGNKVFAFKHFKRNRDLKRTFERNKDLSKFSGTTTLVCRIYGMIEKGSFATISNGGGVRQLSGILMEYVKGIPMNEFIKNAEESSAPMEDDIIIDIMKTLLKGIKLIHRNGFMHRDIKPENVIIDQDESGYVAKIVDFGLSTNRPVSTRLVGSIRYMAPEVIHGDEYNNKCDVYSAGILFYKLVEGRNIYQKEHNNANRYEKQTYGQQYHIYYVGKGFENKLDKLCQSQFWMDNPQYFELLREMLRVDPHVRLSAKEAYQLF